jgi:hypothetical protein
MSAITIAGDVSGSVTLDAPSAAGTTVLTLPATSGTVALTSQLGGGVTSLNGETGAITNTDLYAIGSYVNGRPANGTSYVVNNTVAGSILFSASTTSTVYRTDTAAWTAGVNQNLVTVGTWRCVSAAGGAGGLSMFSGLWVRIS